MRNQKTISRLPRLLALAVVSYVFMVLLTGCTKEEFVAGYNEFMFGDWLPAYGSTSQSAAPGSSTASDPDHVYAEPNPECDAKIASLMSQLYSLESSHVRMSAVPSRAQRMSTTLCPPKSGPFPIRSASPTAIFPLWRAPTTAPSPRWSARCAASCGSITSPKPWPIRHGVTISLPRAA